MPLTTNTGSATWDGATVAITSIIVWPPGLDCDPSRITATTYRKATGFSIAVDDLVNVTYDASGQIATATGGAFQVRATTAAASGATSFQGRKIPQFTAGASHFTESSNQNIGWLGNPTVRVENSLSKDLEFSPVNNSKVYRYVDSGGVEHTTASAATAATGVAFWIDGKAVTRAHAGPSSVDLVKYSIVDYGINPAPITSKTSSVISVLATGTPPTLGALAYTNYNNTVISATGSASTPIYLGTYVGQDTRTSPTTYFIQQSPYVDSGLDASAAVLNSSQQNVTTSAGSYTSTMLGVQLAYIGIHFDGYTYVIPTSGTNAAFRRPTTCLQILAPILNNSPDFAVDCTLPAPYGNVRVIWINGTVRMAKRTDSTTAPRASMIKSNWNPLASKKYNNYFATTDYGGATDGGGNHYPNPWRYYSTAIPLGLLRSENGSAPYPLHGWISPSNGWYNVSSDGQDVFAPCRRGIFPSTVRLVISSGSVAGTTSQRLQWVWTRRNAITRVPYDPIGSPVDVSAPTSLDSTIYGTVAFYDITIPRPAGADEDVGTYCVKVLFYTTTGGVETLFSTMYAAPMRVPQETCNSSVAYSPNTLPYLYYNNNNINNTGYILPVSGDSWPLEVWPEDIVRWSPAPNDAECSYVGNVGWIWPTPSPMPAITRTQNAAASWSANVLTISALPGMTWTGTASVDGPGMDMSHTQWFGYQGVAIRITCPSLGLSLYTYPNSLGQGYGNAYIFPQYWAKSETACPIGYMSNSGVTAPITATVYKPTSAAGAIDIYVDIWEVRLVGTVYGGPAELANYQRVVVTIP